MFTLVTAASGQRVRQHNVATVKVRLSRKTKENG